MALEADPADGGQAFGRPCLLALGSLRKKRRSSGPSPCTAARIARWMARGAVARVGAAQRMLFGATCREQLRGVACFQTMRRLVRADRFDDSSRRRQAASAAAVG